MEAVYFGTCGFWGKGSGNGPWVMADLENGLWAGSDRVNPNDTPLTSEYVTAMVKGGTNGFALKGGDATTGTLTTMYDGPRPQGYQPMHKQGSIILGIGGDNNDSAIGTFNEGLMTSGYTTDAADDAVQANIVAAGYGK
jgi:non-reducing end alpha-L-arabinofuranosidase